jgi:hypothetical protein
MTAKKFELRLVNTPFFARGVSFGDLISVRPDHVRRALVFDRLNAGSGHSTVRIILMEESARTEVQLKLREFECSYEGADQFESLLAVDIPPNVNYFPLREWLVGRNDDGIIGIQESAISAVHRSQLPSFP